MAFAIGTQNTSHVFLSPVACRSLACLTVFCYGLLSYTLPLSALDSWCFTWFVVPSYTLAVSILPCFTAHFLILGLFFLKYQLN